MPAIEVEDISKRYGPVTALSGVSLSVAPGSLTGLIGPDGAGKTTLFRILATLLLPDGGRASIMDMDVVAGYRGIRGCIGYMPQRFSLYPDLTVEENVNFFAAIYNVPRSEGRRLIAPIYSQLAPFSRRRAGKLSGGMKQKLALCCALIHRPRVLLLDEPTTGVDAVSRQEFWELLGWLKGQGITILVSTPYMDEATRCERIALIDKGRILECDTPQALTARYGLADIEQVFIHLMGGHEAPLPPEHYVARGEPAIRVCGLTKRFGAFTAVDHISFEVGRGEIFGFLGANGAGKTTAIRMLCGLSRPTSGHGSVAGFDIATQAEQVKRHIGYMSQRFSLYDDLSVWSNIEFFGGIYGMSDADIRRRGREILDDLDFYGRRHERVADLPPGWKQKLAFSIALLHSPQVVFLDEPTGGVDPVVRRQFWELIYRTARRGVTIFVTTHYMDEAEYCHRISIMVAGRIEAIGTPAELKARYSAGSIDEVFSRLARPQEGGGGAS